MSLAKLDPDAVPPALALPRLARMSRSWAICAAEPIAFFGAPGAAVASLRAAGAGVSRTEVDAAGLAVGIRFSCCLVYPKERLGWDGGCW